MQFIQLSIYTLTEAGNICARITKTIVTVRIFNMKTTFTTTSGDFRQLKLQLLKKQIQVLCLLAFLFLISTKTKAQDELMGLTSNGGPEGKGTAFSIKTNNTGFAVVKGFADWGKGPLGNLVKGLQTAHCTEPLTRVAHMVTAPFSKSPQQVH